MVKKKSATSRSRSQQKLTPQTDEESNLQPDLALPANDNAHMPTPKLRRKLAKRVNFLEKVVDSHKLALQPKIKKRKRQKAPGAALGDLSSLAAALGVAEKQVSARQQRQVKGLGVGGSKKRKSLASRETVRLQKVLAHPQFQENPIAAVAQHLAATLPQVQLPQDVRTNVSGSQKQKARRRQARLGCEMEM